MWISMSMCMWILVWMWVGVNDGVHLTLIVERAFV